MNNLGIWIQQITKLDFIIFLILSSDNKFSQVLNLNICYFYPLKLKYLLLFNMTDLNLL